MAEKILIIIVGKILLFFFRLKITFLQTLVETVNIQIGLNSKK